VKGLTALSLGQFKSWVLKQGKACIISSHMKKKTKKQQTDTRAFFGGTYRSV